MRVRGQLWARWRVRLGYPVALAGLWFAQPTPRWILIGAGIAVIGLVVRGAAAGHLRKNQQLATSGLYAYTRNPLYLGSALLAAGFLAAAHSPLSTVVLVGYFAVSYPPVIRREAAEMRSRYGKAFQEYAARVPLFLPRLTPGLESSERFSWAVYRRNREYEALVGVAAAIALLWLRMRLRG